MPNVSIRIVMEKGWKGLEIGSKNSLLCFNPHRDGEGLEATGAITLTAPPESFNPHRDGEGLEEAYAEAIQKRHGVSIRIVMEKGWKTESTSQTRSLDIVSIRIVMEKGWKMTRSLPTQTKQHVSIRIVMEKGWKPTSRSGSKCSYLFQSAS